MVKTRRSVEHGTRALMATLLIILTIEIVHISKNDIHGKRIADTAFISSKSLAITI